MKTLASSIALCAALVSGGANATLVPALGGQVVNDTDLNITWLSNANLAATNTFGLAYNVDLGGTLGVFTPGGSYIYNDGRMSWGGAMKWIAAMNTANYLGYNDWRLPATTSIGTSSCTWNWGYPGGTDCGYTSTSSEMSHLYYTELGNKSYKDTAGVVQSGYGLINDLANPNDESLFTNFQSAPYWSTEVKPAPGQASYGAWWFNTGYGNQDSGYKGNSHLFVLAVRQTAAVPVPAAAWLLGSGLLGLIGVARRKAA